MGEPASGDVRVNDQGQQETYMSGLGWGRSEALVKIQMICSKLDGCGKTWESDESFQEPDVLGLYETYGRPMPGTCAKCDLSDPED